MPPKSKTEPQASYNKEDLYELYSLIAEHSSDYIAIADTTGVYRYVNPSYKKLGYDPKDLIGGKGFKLVHPDDRKLFEKMSKEFRKKDFKGINPHLDLKYRVRDAQGEYHTFLSSTDIVKTAQGYRVVLVSHDITEDEKRKEELERLQEDYRTIFDNSPDAIYIHDPKTGEVLDVNRTMLRLYGIDSVEEARKLKVEDITGEVFLEGPPKPIDLIRRAGEGEELEFEWLSRKMNGETFWSEVHLKPVTLGGELRVMAIERDISRRKMYEKELSRNEAKFRSVFEGSATGMAILTLNGDFVEVNEAFADMMGYSKQKLLSMNSDDITLPKDRAKRKEAMRRMVEKGQRARQFEKVCVQKGGGRIETLVSMSVVSDGAEPLYYIVQVLDITKMKQYQREIEATKEALDHAHVPIFWVSSKGGIYDVNPAASEMLGYSQAELTDMSIFDMDRSFTPDMFDDLYAAIRKKKFMTVETELAKKSGETFPAEINISLLPGEDEATMFAFVVDISKRKSQEQRMEEHADELERLNRMMVGRELRMRALKEENERLRKRLESFEK